MTAVHDTIWWPDPQEPAGYQSAGTADPAPRSRTAALPPPQAGPEVHLQSLYWFPAGLGLQGHSRENQEKPLLLPAPRPQCFPSTLPRCSDGSWTSVSRMEGASGAKGWAAVWEHGWKVHRDAPAKGAPLPAAVCADTGPGTALGGHFCTGGAQNLEQESAVRTGFLCTRTA